MDGCYDGGRKKGLKGKASIWTLWKEGGDER